MTSKDQGHARIPCHRAATSSRRVSARGRFVIAVLLSAALVTACSAGQTGRTAADPAATAVPSGSRPVPTPEPTQSSSPTAGFDKVLVILEENRSVTDVNQNMPFLAAQTRRFASATHYYAITHPSLPNYIVIAGGSTLGVGDDEGPDQHVLPGTSVFGQALASGHTAKTYAEAMPRNCALRNQKTYAVRHNPWTYFADPAERKACQKFDVPAGSPTSGALSTDIGKGDLPTVSMVIPDLCNDGHDCSATVTDRWLHSWLPVIERGSDFRSGRLAIIVTWDEDDGTAKNHIAFTVINQHLRNRRVSTRLDHRALSATISTLVGAKPLGGADAVPDLAEEFGLTG